MRGDLPMTIHATVVAAYSSTSIHLNETGRVVERRNSFVLRAMPNTRIALETGELISDVNIHLTSSSTHTTPADLQTELSDNAVGHLNYSVAAGKAHLNSDLIWLPELDPHLFLNPNVVGQIHLLMSTLLSIAPTEDPYLWRPNYENLLRVKAISFSFGTPIVGNLEDDA